MTAIVTVAIALVVLYDGRERHAMAKILVYQKDDMWKLSSAPIGTVVPYVSGTAALPQGWVECVGQEVSEASLTQAVRVARLPDYRGLAVMAPANGDVGASEFGALLLLPVGGEWPSWICLRWIIRVE